MLEVMISLQLEMMIYETFKKSSERVNVRPPQSNIMIGSRFNKHAKETTATKISLQMFANEGSNLAALFTKI